MLHFLHLVLETALFNEGAELLKFKCQLIIKIYQC